MGYVAELQQFDTQPAAEPDPEPTDPYAALADLAPRDEQPPGRSADAPPYGHVPAQRDFSSPDGTGRPVSGQAARIRDAWALPEPGAEPEQPRGRFAVAEPQARHADGNRRAGGSLLSGGTGGFAWRPGQPGAHAEAPGAAGWAPADDAPVWFPEERSTDWRQEQQAGWPRGQQTGWHREEQASGWHQEEQPTGWAAEEQANAGDAGEQSTGWGAQEQASGWHREEQPTGWAAEEQATSRGAQDQQAEWAAQEQQAGWAVQEQQGGWAAQEQQGGWASAHPATGWAPAEHWQAAAAVPPAAGWDAGNDGWAAPAAPDVDGWPAPDSARGSDDRDLTVTADNRTGGPPAERHGAAAGHRLPEPVVPRHERRRRIVLGAAATAVLLGAGLCYAALRSPATPPRAAAAPAATASALPSDDALLDPADSGPDAVPAQPTESPKPTTASPTPTPSRRTSSPTRTTPGTALPGAATPGSGTPSAKPTGSASSSASASPSPTTLAPLTATFSHNADTGPDGLTNYVGTVRVANPRDRAAGQWRVTLKVPGGNAVDGDSAVTVTQDGEKVTFAPAGDATIPAGGSVTFTFTVQGVLAAEPSNCAINGAGCA
ncbi:hypothetical protein KRMM14A1004_19330 [Krasilnikovia sp. MM14-A1004]